MTSGMPELNGINTERLRVPRLALHNEKVDTEKTLTASHPTMTLAQRKKPGIYTSVGLMVVEHLNFNTK